MGSTGQAGRQHLGARKTAMPDYTFFFYCRVKHGKRARESPISPNPPTPSTTTTILTTPHPSPPGSYPYTSSSTTCLPSSSGHAPTLAAARFSHSSFKFDAGSSRSNSENQDSDLSEFNTPGYTYTFPRSGEGTPQTGCAYDQVDLPLPTAPPSSGRPDTRYVSHDPIRSNESNPMCSCNTKCTYTPEDSPHLRTQVCNYDTQSLSILLKRKVYVVFS